MQRDKLDNLQRTVYFISVPFMLKDTSNSVRPAFYDGKRLVARSFASFENKKCKIKINVSLQVVELFTLHLVVYFVILNAVILEVKIIGELKFAGKNVVFESCASLTKRLHRTSENNGDKLKE